MNAYTAYVIKATQRLLPMCQFALSLRLLVVVGISTAVIIPTAFSQSSQESTQTYTRTITIRPGDTLTHIALRELGNANHAEQLAAYNEVEIKKILKPGSTLNVPVSLPLRDEFATVIFTKGSVLVNGIDAQANEEIKVNDSVETGSDGYASLVFQTGTTINLQPNTLARIVILHCQPDDDTCVIEMEAERGTLTTDVRRDGKQPTEFRVQTPYASAAVRGTVFDLNADETGLRIGVTEGRVEIISPGTDELTQLDIGFGVAAVPRSPIGEPVELLPAPVFRYVPPRLAKGDYLRWFGLSDTDDYIINIANDAMGEGIVLDKEVSGGDLFTLDEELPTGDYTLALRAVDSKGLKGFRAVSPITLAVVDENIKPVSAAVDREGNAYRISVVELLDSAAGYEVQVASSIDFSDPVSVDINETGTAFVRLSGDKLFARTRALIDRTTVGPFGAESV